MTRLGADATDETIAQLQALGVTFVSRYVSDFPAKNLTAPEAQRLSAAGIDIVTNWENDVNDWTGGHSQGVAYAQRALAQHTACGGPVGAGTWGIYFSVDMQINDPTDPTLHDYFRGINSVLGPQHTGAYAQTSVLRALRGSGLIGCGERGGTWRSMSTFGLPEGLGNPGEFDVEQDGQFNEQYDRDVANSARFGQWRIGGTVILDQDSINAVVQGVHDSILNHQLGEIDLTGKPTGGTITLGVATARSRAVEGELRAAIDALKVGGVDLAALEALIESHLASGSTPGVIAAAVLQHLSAATAGAKP